MDDADPVADALAHLGLRARGMPMARDLRVTLNFHPDVIVRGDILLTVLARERIYRSQFETGSSNGALTAFPGGDRHRWESELFGGAYDDGPVSARPKYGALNHRRSALGGAPRFGSAHLRLRPHVLERVTFCYPDSHLDPAAFGLADRMELIAFVEADTPSIDPLDAYVEAHVHGPLRIDKDVEAVVLDPSHRGTAVEEASQHLPCAVEWHDGFRMSEDRIADCALYRGEDAARLAHSLIADGVLVPRDLGRARHTGQVNPQTLKHVWHCLARFGRLSSAPDGSVGPRLRDDLMKPRSLQ